MAATGYTPIQLYYSTTASQVPLAANMANGELAINITDGKIYYKNNSGVVTLFGSSSDVTTISFGTTGLTPSTATGGAVTVAGTLVAANGGTGQSSYTTGDLIYASGSTALSKLAIGTNGYVLTSSGSAPQWTALSSIGVTTFSAGTTGLTPSSATAGAVTLAGTLNVANGGTGLTSLTTGYIPYGNGTSAFSSSSGLYFSGTNLGVGTSSPSYKLDVVVSNPTRGIVGELQNSAASSQTGTQLEFLQNGVDYWSVGQPAGVSAFAFWAGRYSGADGTEIMRLTNTGNLGLGVTPSTWGSSWKTVQVSSSCITNDGFGNTYIGANWYQTGTGDKYINSDYATVYGQVSGQHQWFVAPSGTAGNAITFTQAMTLDNSGNLALGQTSVGGGIRLDVTGGGIRSKGYPIWADRTSTSGNSIINFSTNLAYDWQLYTEAAATPSFIFYQGGVGERMRIDSSGNVGIGVTPSTWYSTSTRALQVGAYSSLLDSQAGGNTTRLIQNMYFNSGGSPVYISSSYASYYSQASGQHQWYTAPSGTAGATVTFNQAMTLDASGNLGIGTGTPVAMLHTAGSSSVAAFRTPNILEISTVSATAATGTINFDVTTQSVVYYTSNASGNFTLNFRGSSGTSLNTIMSTGDTVTVTFLCTNGGTAYYNSAVQVDGSSVTPKWLGGTAPTSGNASSVDAYTYAIIKTGNAAFTVLASQTKFA